MKQKQRIGLLKTIHACAHFIVTKAKRNKRLMFMEMLIGLCRESSTIISTVFPALLLQLLVDYKQLNPALLVVFGVAIVLNLLGMSTERLRLAISNYSLRAANYMLLTIVQKNMRVDYVDCERSDVIEQYDKGYDGLWNCDDMEYMIISVLFSKLISLATMAYIFYTIHISALLLVIGTLILQWIIEQRENKRAHVIDQQSAAYNHQLGYIDGALYDFHASKDFRIYPNAKKMVQTKFSELRHILIAYKRKKEKGACWYNLVYAAIDLGRMIGVYAIAIATYAHGKMPISNFLLYIGAAKQMTYAVWQIFSCFSYLAQGSRYYHDYLAYMQRAEHERNSGNLSIQSASDIPFIEFRHVSFRYPNVEEYALRDVNLIIAPGQHVAVVGDNGAGKTTFVKLLMRLYKPTEGEILLYGKPIQDYDYQAYLSLFAPVFQDYQLYAFTLGENIQFDEQDAERLALVADITGLTSVVDQLPAKWETPYSKMLYSDGIELSGGEQQKISMARALFRDAPFIIFDEPTAAIDPLMERSIYQTLDNNIKGNTVLYISHRLSSARFCDYVIVFDNGQIVEYGPHEQLMQNKALYQCMYEKQAELYVR